MGQAKNRGTYEQRVAQAIERTRLEDEARSAQFKREEAARIAKLRALPPEERKVVVMAASDCKHRSAMLMAALAGVAGSNIIVLEQMESAARRNRRG